MKSNFSFLAVITLFTSLLFASCSSDSNPVTEIEEPDPNIEFEAVGTDSTLDFATWNLEWFGDTGNGPSNEDLQLQNVHFVISGLDADIWSVQEVVNTSHFETLLDELDGYDGFLANNEFVTEGPAYYSDFGNNEQKVGFIYKSDLISVNSARVILTDYDHEFAGRPPVELLLTATVGSESREVVVILLHAKCCTDNESYERKQTGAEALKSYLDQTRPDDYVMVIGDFNDDVDTSISSGKASAYQNFVDDGANYIFPTKELSDAEISSTVSYPDVIDHHLTSDELYNYYVGSSATSFQAGEYVTNYGNTTSDHYPILSRYYLVAEN